LRELGDESAEKTLVVIHGYGDHGGRYLDSMEEAAARGYRVLLPDLRGHGKSGGRRGHVMRFEDYLDDVGVFMEQVDTEPEHTVMLGHSNGGLITLHWLMENRSSVAAAAVTSPFLGLALEAPGWKLWGAKFLSKLVPTLSLPTEVKAEDVSHDPEVVEAYDTDPLVHHVANARWFTEVMAAIDEVFIKANHIEVPLLVLQAGSDKIADPEATRRWAGSAPAEYVTYEEAAGQYHEVLFEVEGDKYRDRILEYFEKELSAS
jgi:lysophospholipase